jgi:hypothetical protein
MSVLLHCKFASAGCFENSYRGYSGGKGSESLCSQQAYILKFEGCLSTTCLMTNAHREGAIADFRHCGTCVHICHCLETHHLCRYTLFSDDGDTVNVQFLSLEIICNFLQVLLRLVICDSNIRLSISAMSSIKTTTAKEIMTALSESLYSLLHECLLYHTSIGCCFNPHNLIYERRGQPL